MIIDGKKTAAELREELKKKVEELKSTYNVVKFMSKTKKNLQKKLG